MESRGWLWLLAFLAAWIVLNRWVLPWFGVPTCMSGSCRVYQQPPEVRSAALDAPEEEEGESR
ncbi:MAG TPA: hypothetical protein EYH34_17115 [Planctomycetes bacterium]|nr:hypothetical protein [Planctomycetota bacterium]